MVSLVRSRNRFDSILSFSDQLSIPSISIAGGFKSGFKIEDSPLESTVPSSSSSFADGPLDQLRQLQSQLNCTTNIYLHYCWHRRCLNLSLLLVLWCILRTFALPFFYPLHPIAIETYSTRTLDDVDIGLACTRVNEFNHLECKKA